MSDNEFAEHCEGYGVGRPTTEDQVVAPCRRCGELKRHLQSCDYQNGGVDGERSDVLKWERAEDQVVDRDSGNEENDPSHSQIVITQDRTLKAYETKSYFDLNEIAGRRGYSLADLPYVETLAARRELIDWLTAYDERLLVPTPSTQDAGGFPSTTVPDHSPASSPDSE